MKASSSRQAGASALVLLSIVAVVSIVGALSWVFVTRSINGAKTANTQSTDTAITTPAQSSAQLGTVKTELDDMNLDGPIDTSDIDAALQ